MKTFILITLFSTLAQARTKATQEDLFASLILTGFVLGIFGLFWIVGYIAEYRQSLKQKAKDEAFKKALEALGPRDEYFEGLSRM